MGYFQHCFRTNVHRSSIKVLSLLLLLSSALVRADGTFPKGPDLEITPGALCDTPSEFRYPAKVPYCERAVATETKWEVIDTYESKGFEVRRYDRAQFKIDHLIPLCAGGANKESNLWPQHRSLYEKTDEIEATLCQVMAADKISQESAVALIIDVKLNPDTAPAVLADLKQKLNRR